MASNQQNKLILNIVESVGWILGPALFVLHLSSFVVDRSGYYYKTINEWGMAFGVMLICVIFVCRIWRR